MHDLSGLLGDEAMRRVQAPPAEAWTLPPAAYTDPAVFATEAETLFQHEWFCVAHESQLRHPGDYVCADVVNQPLVAVRSMDGEVRVMSSVCRHRAMPVVEGQGNATRFVCPYHSWTYELNGRLRSAPMMQECAGFQPESCRLPLWSVATWNGFVFASRRPWRPLADALAALSREVADRPLAQLAVAATLEFDSPWNWKLLVENFMEAYHHIGTHRHTLEPLYPARMAEVAEPGEASWSLLRMPAADPAACDQPPLLAICVFPLLLFALSSQVMFWYQLEPRGVAAMRLRIHVLVAPDGLADAAAVAELVEEVRAVHEEDIGANLGVWRGVNAPCAAQGRLSPQEKAIWQLNQLYLASLARGPGTVCYGSPVEAQGADGR